MEEEEFKVHNYFPIQILGEEERSKSVVQLSGSQEARTVHKTTKSPRKSTDKHKEHFSKIAKIQRSSKIH